MKNFKYFEEDAPTNATGSAVAGTGDDSSTVVMKKRAKVYRRKKRQIDIWAKAVDEARRKKIVEEERNYRKEYDNYHSQPEQRERNAARLRARRQMEKWGKVKKFDGKDVHHKDNNPLNNEEENLKVTSKKWNRTEPRLRKEESINIEERELTPKELKRREEIAKELSDADFKKRYGKDWKSIKIATATNMAKKEETIMGKKYLETKPGSLEESVNRIYDVWRQPQDSIVDEGFSSSQIKKAVKIATEMGGNMTGAVKKIEKIKKGLSNDSAVKDALQMANEQTEDNDSRVDGRTKAYREAVRRIKMRQERNKARSKSIHKEEVEELEEKNITVYLDAASPDWMKKAMKKYGVKGKIHKRDVNPGYDSWKVTGDPKKLYKLYSDDEYGGEEDFDDFIDMHKEAVEYNKTLRRIEMHLKEAESGDKEAYKKYVEKMLKKFGVNSPADLKGDDKKKFYDALDKGWESDAEKAGKSEDWKKKKNKKDVEDEDENPVGKSYNEAVAGKEALDQIYDIVNKKQHGKVLGVKVDLFTASAMQKVYQALNSKNKDKVEKMLKDKRGVMTFAQFAMSQVK